MDETKLLRDFLHWLRDHTDTFDPVTVRIVLDNGDPLIDDEMIAGWIQKYLDPDS